MLGVGKAKGGKTEIGQGSNLMDIKLKVNIRSKLAKPSNRMGGLFCH